MEDVPERIGPYLPRSVLGRGGMGVVYDAVHHATGRRVALKAVRVPRIGRLSQIRREVQALARLRHPGIVRVVDQGISGITPWYAMDLLEGRTLADMIRASFSVVVHADDPTPTAPTLDPMAKLEQTAGATGLIDQPIAALSEPRAAALTTIRPELTELLGIARRLAQVLSYIHGEGIVHRDVKPSNVFVTEADGRPTLVDFGLATRVGDPSGREFLDCDALTAGSARYIAPEQIRGEPLDPRCDLYSLGCLLFELVTGRPPFIGPLREVVDQHLRRPPPRLSSFVTGAPPELERIIAVLLRKDRRERMGYARDLVAALARWPGPAWASPAPRSQIYLYRPPLVGRSEMMADFELSLRELSPRGGNIALVQGESGVGKTRVAQEVARIASRLSVRVVASTCSLTAPQLGATELETRSAPLEPLLPLIRALADAAMETDDSEISRLLRAAAPLLGPFEPSLMNLPGCSIDPPIELPAMAARERLSRTLFELLAAFTKTEPLLLICDDLQWADEHTMYFLHYLAAGRVAALPVQVLGLVRREERSDALLAFAREPAVRNFDVDRLKPHEVAHMVAGMLSLDAAAPDLVRFLSEKSEGNALFVSEYMRIAVAEQLLVRDEAGQWAIAESAEPTSVVCEALPLPQSLRAVLERRLVGLQPKTQRLLTLAATIGREFELSLFHTAAQIDESTALDAIADLVQHQILEPSPDEPDFRFAHDKLREISYALLDDGGRREAHGHVAAALEQRVDRGFAVEPADLGHHWLEAGELAKSAPHLYAGAEQALRLGALDRAIAHFKAAERVFEQLALTEQLFQVRESLGDALCRTGALAAARNAFERAREAGPPDGLSHARLLRKIGKAHELAHEHEAALVSYDRAEELLPEPSTDRARISEWIRIQRARIWIYYWLARVPEMNASVAALRPHIDSDASALDRSDYYHALASSSYRANRYRVPHSAIEDALRSLAAAEEGKAPLEAAFVRFSLGFGLLFNGQIERAQRELRSAREETRRLGDTLNEVRCLAYLTLTQRRAQQVNATRELAQETLARAGTANMLDYSGLARASLGWVAMKSGDTQSARTLTQDAVSDWSKLSFEYPFQWTGLLTLLSLQLDRSPMREVIAVARKLVDTRLARLPDVVESNLQSAIDFYSNAGHDDARDHLTRALSGARDEGFL